MRWNTFAGAVLSRAALLLSSVIVSAPLLAEDAAPGQPVEQNNPGQPVPQNNEPAPRRDIGPPVSANTVPELGPETVRATAEAERRYMEIAARGDWPRLARPLRPGAKGDDVTRLRRRLEAEGYPSQDPGNGADWDDRLTDAVKRFQANHGLDQTGEVSRATLRELNVSAAARARQLEATAQRLSRLHFHFPQSYVVVNIAGASVEAVEDGKVAHGYTAIVGNKRHESPRLMAKILSVDINPTWTVPASIIKKEIAPRLHRDPNYLARQHIRVLDGRGQEVDPEKLHRLSAARAARFTFRQDPGAKNALGSLRLSMPNKDEVYMHDTPQKELFDRDYRFLSHGCVRVEGVYDLAAWLLKVYGAGSEHWDEEKLRSETETGRTEKIRLTNPAPVVWVYLTGWAVPDGMARFRSDIYGLDKGTRLPPARGTPVAIGR